LYFTLNVFAGCQFFNLAAKSVSVLWVNLNFVNAVIIVKTELFVAKIFHFFRKNNNFKSVIQWVPLNGIMVNGINMLMESISSRMTSPKLLPLYT